MANIASTRPADPTAIPSNPNESYRPLQTSPLGSVQTSVANPCISSDIGKEEGVPPIPMRLTGRVSGHKRNVAGAHAAPRCAHMKGDKRCGSPAVRGNSLCWNHAQQARPLPLPPLPELDSRENLQRTLSIIVNGLFTGRLHGRDAGRLIYTVQQAMANLDTLPASRNTAHSSLDQLRQIEELSALLRHTR